MNNNEKIYRRSGVSIACYVIAVLLLIYTFYTAGSMVGQINDYYAQYEAYGYSANFTDYVTYILQSSLAYFVYAVVVFMLGYILDAVRRTDPSNYMTEEELADAKAAKKEAKEAKKIAKGEKAAAKAAEAAANDEDTIAEDFANDLDKELKADEKKNNYRKSGNGGYKKSGNGNRNNNNNNNHRRNNGNGNHKNNNQDNYKNNDRDANKGGNQDKPKAAEKPVQAEPEAADAVFDVKISEEE